MILCSQFTEFGNKISTKFQSRVNFRENAQTDFNTVSFWSTSRRVFHWKIQNFFVVPCVHSILFIVFSLTHRPCSLFISFSQLSFSLQSPKLNQIFFIVPFFTQIFLSFYLSIWLYFCVNFSSFARSSSFAFSSEFLPFK